MVLRRGCRHSGTMADAAPMDEMLVLSDGRAVRIRPMHSADAAALVEMHEGFSARTVRRRFFSSMPHLSPDQARRFAEVDGTSRVALVAQDISGALVAVARYDCLAVHQSGSAAPAAAEVAIVVADDFQHHGLGVALLTRLIAVARAHGVDYFTADVLMENRPMLATFTDAGLTYTAHADGGVVHVELPLRVVGAVTPAGPGQEPPQPP